MSLNRYLYAGGNPATLIDPTGHAALCGEAGCANHVATPPPTGLQPGADSGGGSTPSTRTTGTGSTPQVSSTLTDNTTAWFDNLSATVQNYIVQTRGAEAVGLLTNPDTNPWDYPLAYRVAEAYLIRTCRQDSLRCLQLLGHRTGRPADRGHPRPPTGCPDQAPAQAGHGLQRSWLPRHRGQGRMGRRRQDVLPHCQVVPLTHC